MKSRQVDFSNGRIIQNMVYSAAPLLLAQVLNLLYSIVDRVYIGQIPGAGVAALGGIGLCFPIISLITGFAN
ncbi:MAG: MATE family efflux transporter, partial [Erysipelotrichaceae bacterium]|nr:MATE family efflux transporter [Erysipelotrichaceae bacterium]